MTKEEIFFKYIKGYRCTREEYLIVQEYLKMASEDIKDLYKSSIKFIIRSLVRNRQKSEDHFLAAASKHGLIKSEALELIEEYTEQVKR